jgi:ATP-dependent Clp protease ATP-binding subunit ClpA
VCLETVREVVELSDQWLWGRAQPDKALELLDASMAHQALEGGESRVLTDDAVCHALARMSGLGVEHLRQTRDPRASLAAVEAAFRRRIVGQPQAWGPLLAGLRSRMLRGLEDRPHLCLLLAGPSGVGKTETARQLAVAFGGSSEALVRLDGSEYSEPHCVARLIGSPPGYVGYGEGGLLTEAVKRRPRCVVLLDEVEKAASTVHNLLLQVMSAGRLTDGTGNSIDFRHSCLILTSNLGNRLTGAGGCPSEAAEQAQAIEAVRRGLPVELLGRLDAIVPFRRLSLPDLQRIVTLKLEELAAALPAIAELVADDATTAWLAQQAWSPNYGAREVDRVIRAEVEPLLSAWLWQDGVESAPRAVRLALTPDQAALALQPLAA